MDAYTSLLNLNFMSAWRTGNSLIDMIIAIIIPIVSNRVATFFSVVWPNFLKSLLESRKHDCDEVKIQHGITDRYHHAVDLTEGSILQEAVELYIDQHEKPFYRVGEFTYSNVVSGRDDKGNKSLAHVLQNDFKLVSRSSHQAVEIGKGFSMRINEGEDKKEDNEENKEKEKNDGNNNNNNNNNNGQNKEGQKQSKMREVIFESNDDDKVKHGQDPVDSFVREAFEWYRKTVDLAPSSQRYLFHPTKTSDKESAGFCNEYNLMCVARYPLFDTKTFNSLFFPEKEKLIALIDQFETKTGKFAVPGFPHRLTLLLHGPPGTGKTSLVKAIAQRTGRHIVSIPLSQVRTNRELIACMHDQCFEINNSQSYCRVTLRADKVIYLLEDADATSDVMLVQKKKDLMKKKNTVDALFPDALSVKGLLEAFGGILDAPKRIIVMTTNHIDRLDPAIARLGFITMRLYMGNFSKEDAVHMVRHYYGEEDATPERMTLLKNIMEQVALQGIEFSPSELEQLCAEYDTIDELIEALKLGSSIAAVKVGLLVNELVDEPCHIRIAATKSAFHFLHRAQTPSKDLPLQSILTDEDEWKEWQGMNDAVMHIELRRWADMVVIAPLDANTLAKISNGLCDNLVTCVMRAWETKQKPVIVCPAMNTAMWTHPVTARHLDTLRSWFALTTENASGSDTGDDTSETPLLPETIEEAMYQVVGPVKKRLACGDVGIGGMAGTGDIANVIRRTGDLIRAKRDDGTKIQRDEKPDENI